MSDTLLKLQAKDADDVQVVSAVLQDAIVPVVDMLYQSTEKQFVLVAQRLRREAKTEKFERICCAVNMRGVENAQIQGIDLNQPHDMLDLLAVMPEDNNLTFVFAGGAKIRLTLGDWAMIVEDFGEPWPAQCNPCHEEAARA